MLRQPLLMLARSEKVKNAVTAMPVSSGIVHRYVPGELTEEAVDATRRLIESGLHVTLDFLGEDTLDREQADHTVSAYLDLLKDWNRRSRSGEFTQPPSAWADLDRGFYAGTTTVEAADAQGWVVSVTPSGGWIPAVIAGKTGIGLSQRAQSFVTDEADGPFNVITPGKRPRVTLTPTLAVKDGAPFLSFAVQGGDSQDQNLLQFFLNMVEWGMTVQQAVEAPNMNSYQMRSSFGVHESRPGRMLVASRPAGGSISTSAMSWKMWFWIMSRRAPEVS